VPKEIRLSVQQQPTLDALGWSPELAGAFEPHAREGLAPARVTAQHRGAYVLAAAEGELTGEPSGRLRHAVVEQADLPAVGDWVAIRPAGKARAVIEAILPRRSAFVRRVASDGHRVTAAQVVAANVDVVLIVTALDRDLNLRRLERYLATAWESGAEPALVLSKADLCPDVDSVVAEVESIALGVPVHAVSSLEANGIDALRHWFREGRTVAVLGSSGVGKSTLINALVGEERQATAGLRADGRGRHTTTHRELIAVPGGGIVLDTPGMRELALWDTAGGLDGSFADVAAFAAGCRFADCGHEAEPGCAVREALADGRLDAERFESWVRLQREQRWVEERRDARAVSEQRKARRRFARSMRKTSW
jgi:ribosome biogenesis GTPase